MNMLTSYIPADNDYNLLIYLCAFSDISFKSLHHALTITQQFHFIHFPSEIDSHIEMNIIFLFCREELKWQSRALIYITRIQ
jgi:hypothetical protein